ncbi:hypothetical protein [Flavobacterium mesophilum]|uniref:hypothetical protein n=1 Tax=Flavobacterium mesophilum TaxID=3143495 RepID=UPI0031DD982D
MLLYQNQVSIDFANKVVQVAKNLSVNPNWLMAVINFETAGTFSPSITNSLGYTGLIQFGAAAAKEMGTTTDALRAMTAIRQLDYVEKYYKIWYKRLGITKPDSFVDMYLITFFPAAVNKPLDYVIKSATISAERLAKANPVFDLDKNKQITVAEIQKVMVKRIPSEFAEMFLKKKTSLSV